MSAKNVTFHFSVAHGDNVHFEGKTINLLLELTNIFQKFH